MEIRESAKCAVAEREFVIELTDAEIARLHRFLSAARECMPPDEMLDEMVREIEYVAGIDPHRA